MQTYAVVHIVGVKHVFMTLLKWGRRWSSFLAMSSYRTIHYSAKRGLAIACRLSVRLSITSGWIESTESHVILGGSVAVCLLLTAHRAVIFAIAQLSCQPRWPFDYSAWSRFRRLHSVTSYTNLTNVCPVTSEITKLNEANSRKLQSLQVVP